ncbi:hypothetical protein BKA65DRAFT_494416 [Rhexocercosporidium sp. MPI-PUGE-AT-0058]|nr:hypothetical protein BKA65DRAFT_494416 [Rhexocercosporidium sp. MPI-PUGE-AT-0058]
MPSSLEGSWKSISWIGLAYFAIPVYSLNSTCGDLITYNQFPNILEAAPTCFKGGCGSIPLTSMSSNCESNSGCFPIWTLLNKKWQSENDWCSHCPDDRACRNPDWPVLNATSSCDASPNIWLFGNGGCCTEGDEPANLAKWIEATCNESWRTQFEYFDGQAKLDWIDYLFAWNWTVSARNLRDGDEQPTCSAKPLYLGLFVIENIVFLLFTVFYAAVTIWIIREKERTHRRLIVRIILGALLPIKLLKKGASRFFKFIFCLSGNGGGTGTVVSTILIAILFAGIQLAANFGTASIIQKTPGYEHVPVPLLALLFCCRPRLGWLACLLSLFPDSWLTKYFHLQPGTEAFQTGAVAVNRVGVSAAVGEIIMQCLSAYFLGKTAHVGVEKGFYLNNHLTPFFRGMEARNMYIGAMFWLVAGFGVVLAWTVFLVWHAALMHFYATTKSWLRHVAATTIPESVQPRRMRSWRRSTAPSRRSSRRTHRLPTIDETNLIGEGYIVRGVADPPEDERHNLRGGIRGPEMSYGSDEIPSGLQNIRRVGGGSSGATYGASSSSAYDALPIRPGDFPQASTTISTVGRDSPPRSRGHGYQAVPVNPEMTQMHPEDFPQSLSPGYTGRDPNREYNILTGSRPGSVEETQDPVYIQHASQSSNSFPDTRYHGAAYNDPEENDPRRTPSPPYNPDDHFPTTFRELQPYIVALAFFLGIISYVAQWLFWAGFVYAAGDRFCPPKLGFTGTLWSIAAILGISTNFLS